MNVLNKSPSPEVIESESELSKTFSQNTKISEGSNVTSHDRSFHGPGCSKDINIDSDTNTVPSKYLFHINTKAGLIS